MDKKLCIAECAKRTDSTYRNREMTWEEVSSAAKRLSHGLELDE